PSPSYTSPESSDTAAYTAWPSAARHCGPPPYSPAPARAHSFPTAPRSTPATPPTQTDTAPPAGKSSPPSACPPHSSTQNPCSAPISLPVPFNSTIGTRNGTACFGGAPDVTSLTVGPGDDAHDDPTRIKLSSRWAFIFIRFLYYTGSPAPVRKILR